MTATSTDDRTHAGRSGRSVLVLSGPNLGMLGTREPDIYGAETLADHVARAQAVADAHGLALAHTHSDHEGDLVAAIHAARGDQDAIIINPAAFTHYAWSLHDALATFDGPVIEVHLSNPDAREPWRRTSVVSPVANATISGLGGLGYELAATAVARLLAAGADREDPSSATPEVPGDR